MSFYNFNKAGFRLKLIIAITACQMIPGLILVTALLWVMEIKIDLQLFAIILSITTFISVIIAVAFTNYLYFPLNALKNKMLEYVRAQITSNNENESLNDIDHLEELFEIMKTRINNEHMILEKKIALRTKHLNKSLEEITNLNFQQEGDYFMTAQLLKPLGGNHSKSEVYDIDYFIMQKKQFFFKKWHEEIGGDICITQSITLENKRYSFVLNADAMGKSIQGAGGILVLGSIINANLERTRKSSLIQKQNPERWLKNCFSELQDVFIGFEDMMYISVVIGLLEENTGTMFYINADHPKIVLLRNNKARFIKDKIQMTKIGMISRNAKLQINCMQLKFQDIIFIGSDGKDDIKLGDDENGHRIINENENLFVDYVEQNKGELEPIVDCIQNSGELTDDISLIRIQYKNNNEAIINRQIIDLLKKAHRERTKKNYPDALECLEAILSMQPRLYAILKRKAKLLFIIRRFADANQIAQEYFTMHPSDTNFMDFLAMTLEKTGATQEAIEIRERYRMRRPQNKSNLHNLAALYQSIGNQSRSQILLAESK